METSWQSWALGLFVTLTLGISAYAWVDTNQRAGEAATTATAARERISVLESKTTTLEQQYLRDLADLKARMARIEEKQDQILGTLSRNSR